MWTVKGDDGRKINNCCVHICYMVWIVNITERSGEDLTDYQVRVEVTDPDFFSECTDQKYVEFYDSDKQTLLSHYTELFDAQNNKAVFWVKVPSIPANGTKTIYLNVNTERTEDLSNGEAVFDFFDDFDRSELGDGYYVRTGSGYSVHDSILDMSVDATIQIESVAKFNGYNDKLILEQKIRNRNTRLVGWARWSGSSYFEDWAGFGDKPDNRYRIETNDDDWGTTYNLNDAEWKILRLEWTDTMMRLSALKLDYTQITSLTKTQSDGNGIQQGDLQFVWYVYSGDSSQMLEIDWVRVRKYTDPEPSVSVTKAGATATLDFKRIVAKALAGKIANILNGDPRIKLYNGGTLIKEITAGARLRKEDTANKRYIVMFLFVDDSNDEYTTDSQELIFPHSDGDYVAFTQSESFEKVSNEPLPLRWEIYVPWTADDFGWG